MNICIVIPPGSDRTLSTAAGPRELYRIDELAKELENAGHNDISVFEGDVTAAPADHWLIVFGLPRNVDSQIGARTVAVNEDRSTIMKTVEECSLAGAVEKQRYFEWCEKRSEERGFGLVGRRDVAQAMGARSLSGPFTSRRYAAIASTASNDLASLISEYLAACDR